MKQTVVIGISSGIAAYKMLDLIRNLRVKDIRVRVVMTKSAGNMISVEEIEKLTGANPLIELFPSGFDYKKVLKEREVDHIKIADSADVFLIAPATANVIAKLAHGIADDALTTTALAITAPVIVCPSMNVNMWSNPATQENLATFSTTLLSRSLVHFLPSSRAAFLSTSGHGINRRPGASLCFLLRHSLLFVSLFNMLGLAFLFICVSTFIPSWHILSFRLFS
jgi:hypothetical protein